MRNAELLTASEFWADFNREIPKARSRVVVHSPYLHPRRLSECSRLFGPLQDRGVVICLTTQRPGYLDGEQIAEEEPGRVSFQTSMELLNLWRTHLNQNRFHHKFVLIDDRILYYGSMNIFSHFNTSECMRRTEDKEEIEEAKSKFNLKHCEVCMNENIQLWGDAEEREHAAKLGILLRKQRKLLKLSLGDLERLSGVTRQTIAAMERGENSRLSAYLRVLEALQLRIALVPKDVESAVLNVTRHYWNEVPPMEAYQKKMSTRKPKRKSDSIIVFPSADPITL